MISLKKSLQGAFSHSYASYTLPFFYFYLIQRAEQKKWRAREEPLYELSHVSSAVSPTELFCSDWGTAPARTHQSDISANGWECGSDADRQIFFCHSPSTEAVPAAIHMGQMSAGCNCTARFCLIFDSCVWGFKLTIHGKTESFSPSTHLMCIVECAHWPHCWNKMTQSDACTERVKMYQ